MAIFENQIKEQDGHLNYDRAEELARQYRGYPSVDPSLLSKEEKKLRQFSTQAMQISKGLYLKVCLFVLCLLDKYADRRKYRPIAEYVH